ncbi:hypothetical protein Peur_041285 [Populus x canadensis]
MSSSGILALFIVCFCTSGRLWATATQMWPDLMKKSREGGLDAIETYVFWNAHEPAARRQYDFSGNLDLVRFLKAIQDEGLYAVLRIGPYVCAEWNYGGFPVWLHNMPGIQMRTDNDVFKNEMQNFTTLIDDMVKRENLFASQGGPVILAQIENEYGNVMSSYGEEGKAYMNWCTMEFHGSCASRMMLQNQWSELVSISTCNGWYCDQYQPRRSNIPKMWTENWTGWYKNWGGKDPHRTAEDLAFAVARFYQLGGTFQNYYMQLHDLLHSMEDILTTGNVSFVDLGDDSVGGTIYSNEGGSSCFLANVDQGSDKTINFQGINYTVPAWSVSILPDCQNVSYNTAKVSTQTSVMVKKANVAEDEPISLKWSWRPEMDDKTILLGKGDVTINQILDQKEAANDLSDYLFYMTSVNLKKDDPVWSYNMTLRVKSSGQILHAFVNGELIDPVVVDLLGMGKGLAWVNGNNIGRYWPSFIAEGDCNLEPCDYRGSYDSSKCLSNCGHPTQRWYHVPRSFLNDTGDNTLVLFEEFGGNPSSVNFQTIAIGSACISAEENRKIELSCQGRPISAVKFASFGNPQGSCGSFVKGYCEGSKDALSVVEKACVGQESCTIDVSEDTFGSTTCGDDVIKTLSVEAIC